MISPSFHQLQEKLPKIDKVGDVACFHHINFPNDVQGIGQSFSSSLSFSGRLGSKVKPRMGSVSYTFTARDERNVKELRLWSARKCRTPNPYILAATEGCICQYHFIGCSVSGSVRFTEGRRISVPYCRSGYMGWNADKSCSRFVLL